MLWTTMTELSYSSSISSILSRCTSSPTTRDTQDGPMTNARCPGNLCAYVKVPTFNGSKEESIDSLLHDFCKNCSSQAQREPLCDFCRHLRLHHLAICLRQKLTHFGVELDLDHDNHGSGISRILSNTECALCNLLANAIHSYFVMSKKHDGNEENMRENTGLFLSLTQNHGDGRLILRFNRLSEIGEIEIAYRQSTRAVFRQTIRGRTSWSTVKQWIRECLEPSKGWGPDIGDQITWPTVQKWIRQCTRRHHCMRLEFSEMPQGFRLVDVNKRQLVSDFPSGSKLGQDIEFIALSYVWGTLDTSRTNALLNSNKHELTALGGLAKLSLPKAIEDAITICQRLRRRFLWVDRLCIQQDDNGPEKQAQINAMGDIYSSAEFTIIHASGAGMEDPIAGVGTTRKILQSRTVLCGLELMSGYPDITVPVQGSRWNERGWTYQEAVLSRRKLFFTPFELWFECSDSDDAYKREEQCSRRRLGSHISDADKYRMTQYKLNGFADGTTIFHDFIRHLESFTARSLTHQSDILNAFMGILTTLYEGDLSIYGLPEADFDQAMLWYCKAKRWPAVGASGFPSWSWPSVSGTVTAPTVFMGKGFLGTLTQWYYKDRNGEVKIVKSKNSLHIRRSPDSSAQAHLLVAWWKGCVEPTIPEDVNQELENRLAGCEPSDQTQLSFIEAIWRHIQNAEHCATCESQIARRWACLEDVWKDIQRAQNSEFEDTQHFTTGSREEERHLIEQLHPGVLLTRAQTTCYKVSKIITQHQDPRARTTQQQTPAVRTEIHFVDSEGRKIGKVRHEWSATEGEEFLDNTKPEELSQAVPFECMGVSLSDDQGRSTWIHKSTVNVLVIHRKEGSPFWRRIAVGWVYLADWIKADRTFKTIGLE